MMARALFSSVILPKDATNKVVDDLEKSLSELAHLFSLFASPLIVFSISPYPNEFEPHPDDAEKDRQAKLTLRELRYKPSGDKMRDREDQYRAVGPLIDSELIEATDNEIDLVYVSSLLQYFLYAVEKATECIKGPQDLVGTTYFVGLCTDLIKVICGGWNEAPHESTIVDFFLEVREIAAERLYLTDEVIASRTLKEIDISDAVTVALEDYDAAFKRLYVPPPYIGVPANGARSKVGIREQLIPKSLMIGDLRLTEPEIARLQNAAKVTFQREQLGELTLPFIRYITGKLSFVHGAQPAQAGRLLKRTSEVITKVIDFLDDLCGTNAQGGGMGETTTDIGAIDARTALEAFAILGGARFGPHTSSAGDKASDPPRLPMSAFRILCCGDVTSPDFLTKGPTEAPVKSRSDSTSNDTSAAEDADATTEIDPYRVLGVLVEYQLMRVSDNPVELAEALEFLKDAGLPYRPEVSEPVDLPYTLEVLKQTLDCVQNARDSLKNPGGAIGKPLLSKLLSDLAAFMSSCGREHTAPETVDFIVEAGKIIAERLARLGETRFSSVLDLDPVNLAGAIVDALDKDAKTSQRSL
jgi:hypothetical protein